MDALLEEISALEATMMDNVVVKHDESGRPFRVSTVICPATADNPDAQFVRVTLSLSLPPDYPDTSPQVCVDQCRGLSEERVADLITECRHKMVAYRGEPVLYTVFETAREWLTDSNRPSIPCAICLYDFSERDIFSRTDCFHHFHVHCLARYVTFYNSTCQNGETEEIEDRRLPEWMRQKEDKFLGCPVCREPLSDSLVSSVVTVDAPAPELCQNDVLLTPDTLPPELLAVQSRLKELSLIRNKKRAESDEGRLSPLVLTDNISDVTDSNSASAPISGTRFDIKNPSGSDRRTSNQCGKCSDRPNRSGQRDHRGGDYKKAPNGGRPLSFANSSSNGGITSSSNAASSGQNQNHRSFHGQRGGVGSDNRIRGQNGSRQGCGRDLSSNGRGSSSSGRGFSSNGGRLSSNWRGSSRDGRGHRTRRGGASHGYSTSSMNAYAQYETTSNTRKEYCHSEKGSRKHAANDCELKVYDKSTSETRVKSSTERNSHVDSVSAVCQSSSTLAIRSAGSYNNTSSEMLGCDQFNNVQSKSSGAASFSPTTINRGREECVYSDRISASRTESNCFKKGRRQRGDERSEYTDQLKSVECSDTKQYSPQTRRNFTENANYSRESNAIRPERNEENRRRAR